MDFTLTPSPPRWTTYALLGISALFSVSLVEFIAYYSGRTYYDYLLWNLFLAAIPLGLSLVIRCGLARLSNLALALLTGVWLLFFPNAPYLLTDLIHLGANTSVPLWYDLVVLLSFAWNGLVLGLVSLQEMQAALSTRLNRLVGWGFVGLTLALGSFGIYLGRYLRWNSWDVVTDPVGIAFDVLPRLLEPAAYLSTWGMTLAFAAFLGLCYLMLSFLNAPRLAQGAAE